jgi:DNA-directed RNA polymerase subunit E'/Rpb7
MILGQLEKTSLNQRELVNRNEKKKKKKKNSQRIARDDAIDARILQCQSIFHHPTTIEIEINNHNQLTSCTWSRPRTQQRN